MPVPPIKLSNPTYALEGLLAINVIIGKNGCGKSTLLRSLCKEESVTAPAATRYAYVTLERGGNLVYVPGAAQDVAAAGAYQKKRLANSELQFREQSYMLFDQLERAAGRRVEAYLALDDFTGAKEAAFSHTLARINDLLGTIQIRREGTGFVPCSDDGEFTANDMSSGETEIVSLAIECLMFATECVEGATHILLLDEPDLHLHPDLQHRFVRFLCELVDETKFRVVIVTHSTAILGALSEYDGAAVSFMVRGETHLSFCQIDDIVRDIVPVFGAHPLSQVVSQRPILLVEGGDDVRIWQQAVRSSEGCMALHPCACGSVDRLNAYEQASVQILDSVYDDPRAFSLRDRDGVVEDIDDSLPLIRMRLACRNAENLILTDEVLGVLGTDWDAFRSRLNMWIDRERGVTEEYRHRYFNAATRFAEDCDRKCADIKQCRTLFVGEIACSNMPWEVAVGKAIAGYAKRGTGRTDAGSRGDFLGEKVMLNLVPRQPQRDE